MYITDNHENCAWVQPLGCGCAANRCSLAGVGSVAENGCTLVIHKILLDACGNQACTPRTFSICVKGPSYPCGEVFQMTAGSCRTLDEPLVLTGLICGDYTIEEINDEPRRYCSTITGSCVCGNCVRLTPGCPPAVVTIINRRRLCRWGCCSGIGSIGGCGGSCGCGGCSCGCGGSSCGCGRSSCGCGSNSRLGCGCVNARLKS